MLSIFKRVLLLSLILQVLPVCAEGFPGKGDRFAWSNAIPYYNLANKYLEHGRFAEAVQNYEEAIYRYEFDPDFYVNYGVALRKSENYSGAEQAFRRALELRGDDWQSWSNLANALLKQNRLNETISCFEKAMKVSPPPPAAERAAMLKDIADIRKILSMQQPRPAVQSASKAGYKQKNSAGAKKNQSAKTPRQPAPPAEAASRAPEPDLKKSGWDWVQ